MRLLYSTEKKTAAVITILEYVHFTPLVPMECDVALAPDFKCDKSIIAEVICFSNLQAQEKENKLRKYVIVCIQFVCAR
jgi:hypothetical protein